MKTALVVLLSAGAWAQTAGYPRNHISGQFGAAIPGQDLKNSFAPAFALGFNYGYRITRNFQADVGLDTAFQSARVRQFLDTGFGALRIRDFQLFIPVGGRVVLPINGDRAEFYAGGGGVFARYYEAISQPNVNFRFACPPCSARSGFGYYGVTGFRYRPSQYGAFWIGGSVRVIRVNTDGEPIGNLQPPATRDRWIIPTFDIGFSF